MRRVDDAALEEGQLVVKFQPVDMEGVLRRADPAQRLLREQALIGQIVDGQDGRDLDRVPGEVGRHQRGLPVIGVNQIGCPILVQCACRELGGGGGKPPEADIVVGPVPAGRIAIGVAGTVVKLRTEQDVNRQPVLGRGQPERTGRHIRQCRTVANDLNMQELLDDIAISREQDPDVAPRAQSAGQGRRDGRKAAHPDKIVHFRGDEQNPQKKPSCPPGSIHARTVPVSLHCEERQKIRQKTLTAFRSLPGESSGT